MDISKCYEGNLARLRESYGHYIKLELGPGRHGKPPYNKRPWATLGLRPSSDPHSDIYQDLEYGIPLPAECVDEIYCNQVLEHIRSLIFLMNDCWRVLKPGGFLEACVPHWLSESAWGDPTHVRAFTKTSFQYFCLDDHGKPFVDAFSDYGIECKFILEKNDVRPQIDIVAVLRKPT
jgi:SAM-dependent methyltransferase